MEWFIVWYGMVYCIVYCIPCDGILWYMVWDILSYDMVGIWYHTLLHSIYICHSERLVSVPFQEIPLILIDT